MCIRTKQKPKKVYVAVVGYGGALIPYKVRDRGVYMLIKGCFIGEISLDFFRYSIPLHYRHTKEVIVPTQAIIDSFELYEMIGGRHIEAINVYKEVVLELEAMNILEYELVDVYEY